MAIIACLLWSTAFFSIKIGLPYTSPLNFAGVRFLLSGLVIIPFCGGIKKYVTTVRKNIVPLLKISLFQTFLLYSLFYLGLKLVPASITAIVMGGGPLFIAIMSHMAFHDDKMNIRKMLSISLGIVGIVIIAASKYKLSWVEGKEFWGILILIAANISGGYGNIMVAKYREKGSALIFNSAQLAIGGLAILLISLPIESSVKNNYTWEYFVILGWLTFVSSVGFSIWFILLQRPKVKVSEVNIWKFLVPLFGAILSWIIVPTESPELIPIIGMVTIALSLVVLNYNNMKKVASKLKKK